MDANREIFSSDLLQAYELFTRISRYPELVDKVRAHFLEILEAEQGLTRKELGAQSAKFAAEQAEAHKGQGSSEASCRDLLIDLHFARHYDLRKVEDCINWVRKQESMRQLTILLNRPNRSRAEILKQLEAFCRLPVGDTLLDQTEMEGVRVHLIKMFLNDHLEFIGLAKKHIFVRDINEMMKSVIGRVELPGLVGGKSAGLILASKILKPTLSKTDPDFEQFLTVPETFYVTSTVSSEFLHYNDLADLHTHKYRKIEEIRQLYPALSERFRRAAVPPEFRDQMRALLEKAGDRPLIVRSSSHLEDNSGFSFAGKYDSIFVANQGTPDQRLEQLLQAVKGVYASIYGPDPILYRKKNGLLDYDENMALTIQAVVGRRFGDYFFPFAAGVAYSKNIYRWSERIRREDGFLRLVFGLGTRAVDRLGEDFARLVPLSHPTMRTEIATRDIMKYSQHWVDVLNLKSLMIESVAADEMIPKVGHPDIADAVSVESEEHLQAPISRLVDLVPGRFCITFDNFLRRRPFVRVMKKVLTRLEECYGQPVDVEFAYDGDKIYLLQCRILRGALSDEAVEVPKNLRREDQLFRFHSFFPGRKIDDVEYLVWVDPDAYDALPTYSDKIQVARAVGAVNDALHDRRYVLAGPGRWGSSDLQLGVKTTYSDLCNAVAIGEIVFAQKHNMPEFSYGTHFFHNLIEANVLPFAVVSGRAGEFVALDVLRAAPNRLKELVPGCDDVKGCVKVVHLPSLSKGRPLTIVHDGARSAGAGFFPDRSRRGRRAAARGGGKVGETEDPD